MEGGTVDDGIADRQKNHQLMIANGEIPPADR
jgi:hypothetical protein